MSGVPWAAVQTLGQFAGIREEGNRIFKSETNEDPDFTRLPVEVQNALVVLGRLAPDPEPVQKSEPVQQAEFPLASKAAGDKAKAEAGTAKRLVPGEARKMASDIIAADVKRIRKEHPNWSEAKTWSWALENDEHAILTYNRGEQAERESRRPTKA
jgi:hypothetical protein